MSSKQAKNSSSNREQVRQLSAKKKQRVKILISNHQRVKKLLKQKQTHLSYPSQANKPLNKRTNKDVITKAEATEPLISQQRDTHFKSQNK